MGCAASADHRPSVSQARSISRAIDASLEQEKPAITREVKILLLGTGDSGKTTVLKQLRVIYGSGFTPEEYLDFRSIILQNVVACAKALVAGMKKLQIPYGFDHTKEYPEEDEVQGCRDPIDEENGGDKSAGYPDSVDMVTAGNTNVNGTPNLPRSDAPKSDTDAVLSGLLSTEQLLSITSDIRISSVPRENNSTNVMVPPKPVHAASQTPTAAAARRLFVASGPGSQQALDCAKVVRDMDKPYGFMKDEFLSQEYCDCVKKLWEDSGVQYCYVRRAEVGVPECCRYVMENLERIGKKEYMPTDQDVIQARIMTQTISKTVVSFEKQQYSIIDVGGQKSQRRKWAPFFDDVRAVVFVVAMSGFDQVLVEDGRTNRIRDALHVFSCMVNLPAFANVPFIVFMNKKDVFKEKVRDLKTRIADFFPEFKGEETYEDGATFFVDLFKECNRNEEREVVFHLTFATDGNSLRGVMEAVFVLVAK
ncbi:Guanine nucleotide-binding protein G(o) subunit alpha [Rhizoclosmatium sp. JEL0117]|nr:Guanine nucleotide-binding protein G(o) subunit alpha [Rhizoclosmatium sp. JEL0117]